MTEAKKPSTAERLKLLLSEYGPVALWVYFGVFALVFAGFAGAIHFGVDVEGAAATASVWGAAYVATKLTQPLRIAATLALTPLVVVAARRLRR